MKKEDIFNMRDEQGNTVLHLATLKKQRQVIELLLGHQANASQGLEVNAINHSGLTAFDLLLIFPSEAGDREIEEILRSAGDREIEEILRSAGATGMRDDNQTSVEQSCSFTIGCSCFGGNNNLPVLCQPSRGLSFLAMNFTYDTAVISIAPDEVKLFVILTITILPLAIGLTAYCFRLQQKRRRTERTATVEPQNQ
ncbi:hypothetical protein WN943_015697 [Citrus x changshan-huyou]